MGAASTNRLVKGRKAKRAARRTSNRLANLREETHMRIVEMQKSHAAMAGALQEARDSVPCLEEIIRIRKFGFFRRIFWAVAFVFRGLPGTVREALQKEGI
jgi:hypothetical protein